MQLHGVRADILGPRCDVGLPVEYHPRSAVVDCCRIDAPGKRGAVRSRVQPSIDRKLSDEPRAQRDNVW